MIETSMKCEPLPESPLAVGLGNVVTTTVRTAAKGHFEQSVCFLIFKNCTVNEKPITISCKLDDCQMDFCYNMILNGRDSVPETCIINAINKLVLNMKTG